MNDEGKTLGGKGSTLDDNPWDLRSLSFQELLKCCAVVFLATLGFVVLNMWPRAGDAEAFPFYVTKSYQSGWPLIDFEYKKFGEPQRGPPVKYGFRPAETVVNVVVAALMIASLPALKTFNIPGGEKPWGVGDMLILLTGTTVFVFATFRSVYPCFWLPVLFAVPTFYSAPAAVILLASWGWRRLVPNDDIEA